MITACKRGLETIAPIEPVLPILISIQFQLLVFNLTVRRNRRNIDTPPLGQKQSSRREGAARKGGGLFLLVPPTRVVGGAEWCARDL